MFYQRHQTVDEIRCYDNTFFFFTNDIYVFTSCNQQQKECFTEQCCRNVKLISVNCNALYLLFTVKDKIYPQDSYLEFFLINSMLEFFLQHPQYVTIAKLLYEHVTLRYWRRKSPKNLLRKHTVRYVRWYYYLWTSLRPDRAGINCLCATYISLYTCIHRVIVCCECAEIRHKCSCDYTWHFILLGFFSFCKRGKYRSLEVECSRPLPLVSNNFTFKQRQTIPLIHSRLYL